MLWHHSLGPAICQETALPDDSGVDTASRYFPAPGNRQLWIGTIPTELPNSEEPRTRNVYGVIGGAREFVEDTTPRAEVGAKAKEALCQASYTANLEFSDCNFLAPGDQDTTAALSFGQAYGQASMEKEDLFSHLTQGCSEDFLLGCQVTKVDSEETGTSSLASLQPDESRNSQVALMQEPADDRVFPEVHGGKAPWLSDDEGATWLPGMAGTALSELPSQGSVLHKLQRCKPCAWYWKEAGCKNGWDCGHCHLCPQGEIKARKKAKQVVMRLAVPDRRTSQAWESRH
ncbi:unnamed protein product [Symbiodinium microadriaticum]|nr:unnamed protein product [Symbiodinium microadriaticum]CAE7915309.1 unnamed protein product [Symbiodinium sp. KB8]